MKCAEFDTSSHSTSRNAYRQAPLVFGARIVCDDVAGGCKDSNRHGCEDDQGRGRVRRLEEAREEADCHDSVENDGCSAHCGGDARRSTL